MFADRLFGDMAPREHPYHRGMHRDPPADPAASPTTRPTVLIGDSNSAADLALRRQIYFGEPLPAEAEEGLASTSASARPRARRGRPRATPRHTSRLRLKGDAVWLKEPGVEEGRHVACACCGAGFYVRAGVVANRGVCGACSARGARYHGHDGSRAMEAVDERWRATLHGGSARGASARSARGGIARELAEDPRRCQLLGSRGAGGGSDALLSNDFDEPLERSRIGFEDRGKRRDSFWARPSSAAAGGTAEPPPWVTGEAAGGPSGGSMLDFERFRQELALARSATAPALGGGASSRADRRAGPGLNDDAALAAAASALGAAARAQRGAAASARGALSSSRTAASTARESTRTVTARLASPATPLGGTARAGGASKRGILAPVASAPRAVTAGSAASKSTRDRRWEMRRDDWQRKKETSP